MIFRVDAFRAVALSALCGVASFGPTSFAAIDGKPSVLWNVTIPAAGFVGDGNGVVALKTKNDYTVWVTTNKCELFAFDPNNEGELILNYTLPPKKVNGTDPLCKSLPAVEASYDLNNVADETLFAVFTSEDGRVAAINRNGTVRFVTTIDGASSLSDPKLGWFGATPSLFVTHNTNNIGHLTAIKTSDGSIDEALSMNMTGHSFGPLSTRVNHESGRFAFYFGSYFPDNAGNPGWSSTKGYVYEYTLTYEGGDPEFKVVYDVKASSTSAPATLYLNGNSVWFPANIHTLYGWYAQSDLEDALPNWNRDIGESSTTGRFFATPIRTGDLNYPYLWIERLSKVYALDFRYGNPLWGDPVLFGQPSYMMMRADTRSLGTGWDGALYRLDNLGLLTKMSALTGETKWDMLCIDLKNQDVDVPTTGCGTTGAQFDLVTGDNADEGEIYYALLNNKLVSLDTKAQRTTPTTAPTSAPSQQPSAEVSEAKPRVLWHTKLDDVINGTLIGNEIAVVASPHDDSVWITTSICQLIALNGTTGGLVMNYDLPPFTNETLSCSSVPAIGSDENGTTYGVFSSSDGRVVAVNLDGTEKFVVETNATKPSSPQLTPDYAYALITHNVGNLSDVNDLVGHVTAVDVKEGAHDPEVSQELAGHAFAPISKGITLSTRRYFYFGSYFPDDNDIPGQSTTMGYTYRFSLTTDNTGAEIEELFDDVDASTLHAPAVYKGNEMSFWLPAYKNTMFAWTSENQGNLAGVLPEWQNAVGDKLFESTPSVSGDFITNPYIWVNDGDYVHCINALYGNPVWSSKEFSQPSTHKQLQLDTPKDDYRGALYRLGNTVLMTKFNAVTGRKLWEMTCDDLEDQGVDITGACTATTVQVFGLKTFDDNGVLYYPLINHEIVALETVSTLQDPTLAPTGAPSNAPTKTAGPSDAPSRVPSVAPSSVPSSTPAPSNAPSKTSEPSGPPTNGPSDAPTSTPDPSGMPSDAPSGAPTASLHPSSAPSDAPSKNPSNQPSGTPSKNPSNQPSGPVPVPTPPTSGAASVAVRSLGMFAALTVLMFSAGGYLL